MRLNLLRSDAAVTTLDQALSSLTNLGPAIVAAKVLTVQEFGIFGLLQLAYIVGLGASRSSCTEVAIVRAPSLEGDAARRIRLGAVDVIGSVGLVPAAVAALVLFLVSGGSVAAALAVAGVLTMLVQDGLRMLSIATGRPWGAVVNDALWLATVAVALTFLLLATPDPGSWSIAAVWGLSSLPGLVYGARAVGWRPQPARAVHFLRSSGTVARSFLAEWAVKQGATQTFVYVVGLVGGLAAVGGIRAAQLLLGPVNVVFGAVVLTALPRAAALRRQSGEALQRFLIRLSLGLAGASLVVGVTLAVVPTSWLRVALGAQAEAAGRYVLPLSVSMAGTALIAGSDVGLRVIQAGRRLFRTRVMSTCVLAVGGSAGYAVARTPDGILWGLAIGAVAGGVLWRLSWTREAADALLTSEGAASA